ncbi:MAG: hypothetical protein U0V02_10140 [Anaerolineales bacterium]
MQSNPIILFTVIVIFGLIVLGMIALVVSFARNSTKKKEKIAKALGLSITDDTNKLLGRVLHINGYSNTGIYLLSEVFYRRHAQGGEVYYFDLLSHSLAHAGNGKRKSSFHTTEASVLGFVSPMWNLPLFKTFPKLGDGKVSELGNKAAEAALDIKFELIKSPHIPNLDELYLISTPASSAEQIHLPDGFLRALASHPGLNIHVGGDTMTISYYDMSASPNEQKMLTLYKIGLKLARELQPLQITKKRTQ